jgi:hypothetical protein
VIRQYRFLLRTASIDALEAAHREALTAMSPDRKESVLQGVREGLVAGLRASPDDVRALAHLLTVGERRSPGAFLKSCDPATLHELAQAVLLSEASFGLFGGYDVWDGAEPTQGPERDDSEFGERWHAHRLGRDELSARSYDGWGGV